MVNRRFLKKFFLNERKIIYCPACGREQYIDKGNLTKFT